MHTTIYILEMIGVIAFAISGMIEARSKNMDPVGVYTIAFITALGGGTLRDLILGNHPIYWIQHQEQPVLILLISLLYSYLPSIRRLPLSAIVLPDAIGLGIFSVLGAQLALQMGNTLFIASLLGVMTGTFGGLLRDTLCNEMPFILRKDQIYASVSFVGCWVYFGCQYWLTDQSLALWCGFSFIVIARLLAYHFDIRLQRDNS